MYIYVVSKVKNNDTDLYEKIKSINQSKKDLGKFIQIMDEFKESLNPLILKDLNKGKVKIEQVFKNENELSEIITSLKVFVVLQEFKKGVILDEKFLSTVLKDNDYGRHQLFNMSIIPSVYGKPYEIFKIMNEYKNDLYKFKEKYNKDNISEITKEIGIMQPEVTRMYSELKRQKQEKEDDVITSKELLVKLSKKLLVREIQLVKGETINKNIPENKYIVVIENTLYNPKYIRIDKNAKYKTILNNDLGTANFFQISNNIDDKNNEIRNFEYTYLSTGCDSQYDLLVRKLSHFEYIKNILELMGVDKIPDFKYDNEYGKSLEEKVEMKEEKNEKIAEKTLENKIFMQVSEFDYKYLTDVEGISFLEYKEVNVDGLDFVIIKKEKTFISIHKQTGAVSSSGKSQKECIEKLKELIEKNGIEAIKRILTKKVNIFTKCYSADTKDFDINIIKSNNDMEKVTNILKKYAQTKIKYLSDLISVVDKKFNTSIENLKNIIIKDFGINELKDSEYSRYILSLIMNDCLDFIKPVQCGSCGKDFFHLVIEDGNLKCPHCGFQSEQSDFTDINL